MSSPQVSVIKAAVRTFSDNAELQLAATGLLTETRVDNSEEAIARWDTVDSKNHGRIRRWLPWGMLVVVSALMWLADSKEMIAYFQWVKWLRNSSYYDMPPAQAEQRIAARLDARGKLLVFGDLTTLDRVERKKKLWQSDPENPAYFAEYATRLVANMGSPDILQTARRLDPDNAWFTYLAASMVVGDSVQNTWIPRWRILDQAKLDRSLALLREARTQTKCTSYAVELLRKRLSLLPQGNFMERHDSVSSMDTGTVYSKIQFDYAANALAAGAWSAGEKGDVAAFQEMVRDGDHFLRAVFQLEVSNLQDESGCDRYATTLAMTFAETAAKLGLQKEADRWKEIADESLKHQYDRISRKFKIDGKEVPPGTVTGSMLRRSIEKLKSQQYLATPLPLTDADVKPGRLLDHVILSRFFNYICWLVMALSLGLAAAYRFRFPQLVRRLAARLTELLHPADWVWILGLGILLPFAYVMGINRLTPLGGREFGMMGTAMLMPAGHFLGLLGLWLVTPVQIIRWRLARRASGFGFSGPSRIGWVAVISAAAVVQWIGWIAITGRYPDWWAAWMRPPLEGLSCAISELPVSDPGIDLNLPTWLLLILLIVPVLWLCGVIARALFCRADRQLYLAAAARVLVISWAAALCVLCLASQGFKAEENYWIARDELGRMDPARPAMSVYEYRTAVQLHKEMQDIFHFPAL